MSIDKSLRTRSKLARRRNVFSRAERIEKLSAKGRWQEGDSVFSLPKVKSVNEATKLRAYAKQAAKEAAESAPAEANTAQETKPKEE